MSLKKEAKRIKGEGYYLLTQGVKVPVKIFMNPQLFEECEEDVFHQVRAATEFPGVTDVAVLGVPDERWGESVVAVLECRGERPSTDSLRGLCQDRLASFKVPGEFVFAADLPRTAAGKIAKYRLRDELGGRS